MPRCKLCCIRHSLPSIARQLKTSRGHLMHLQVHVYNGLTTTPAGRADESMMIRDRQWNKLKTQCFRCKLVNEK